MISTRARECGVAGAAARPDIGAFAVFRQWQMAVGRWIRPFLVSWGRPCVPRLGRLAVSLRWAAEPMVKGESQAWPLLGQPGLAVVAPDGGVEISNCFPWASPRRGHVARPGLGRASAKASRFAFWHVFFAKKIAAARREGMTYTT